MNNAPSRQYLYWLSNASHDEDNIHNAIRKYKDSIEVAKIACLIYRLSLRHFGNEMKDNMEIVLLAMQCDPVNTINWASNRIRNSKNLAMQYVHLGGFDDIADNLKLDKEVVLRAMTGSRFCLDDISDELCDDVDVVMGAVNCCKSFSMGRINARFWRDRNITLALVKKDWNNMIYASKHFSKDREIMMCAVEQSSEALKWASAEFCEDKDIIRLAVGVVDDYSCLWLKRVMSLKLQKDEDFMMSLIYCNKNWVKHCGRRMNSLRDKELMEYAVVGDPLMMYFADGILTHNKHLLALSYLPSETWRLIVPINLQPRGYLIADVLVCLRLGLE